ITGAVTSSKQMFDNQRIQALAFACDGTLYAVRRTASFVSIDVDTAAVNQRGTATSHDWDALAIECSPQASLGRLSTAVDDVVGNRDGVPDPNETLDVQIAVTNSGAVTATGVTGTLSSATPGVTVVHDTSSYPDIASGM